MGTKSHGNENFSQLATFRIGRVDMDTVSLAAAIKKVLKGVILCPTIIVDGQICMDKLDKPR